MTIKIKDIVGAVVSKYASTSIHDKAHDWNSAIDAQGEVSLGNNRDRLAERLYRYENRDGDWSKLDSIIKCLFLAKADYVIEGEGEIIERVI